MIIWGLEPRGFSNVKVLRVQGERFMIIWGLGSRVLECKDYLGFRVSTCKRVPVLL